MPVYNTAKYLEECIDSILNQTFTDFEFIISDDGSSDGSKEIIKSYAEKDNRVIFLDNPKNRGIVDNLNDCLAIAKGEYIAIMESDDISISERFAEQIKYLDKNPDISLIGSWGDIIDENGVIQGGMTPIGDYNKIYEMVSNLKTFSSSFINPSVMFRKKILNKTGKYDKKYDFIQDYEFFTRVILMGIKVENLSLILIKYRVHSSSNSANRFKKIYHRILNLQFEIIEKFNLKLGIFFKYKLYLKYVWFIILNQYIICFIKQIGIYSFLSNYWRKYVLRIN
ncbi:MAG: glycosyltransferase [Candidatus Gracilibacteria bacterium]|nr:glycosyltransferase [Candidatus Gracilibacteria bacterium]